MLSLKATILAALWTTGATAGDITHWFTTTCTETAWATPEKEFVTYWSTSTYWKTQWSTAPPETVWNTVWSTVVQPTTYVSVETDTVTTTEFIYSTADHYFTDTAVETQVSRETATATVTATVTSASVVVSATTALITVTETTCPPTTTSLVGLVTCTTRDINPTYTPTAALPSDYLWGCPPGTLCTPKQIGCNFEQDLPGPEYVCSPDECKTPPPLPPLNDAWIDYNCTPFVPAPGYINLNPLQFGLDFSIFQFNGQPGHSCPPPPPPPPSTTWQAPPPPPPPTIVWSDWTTSPAPPPPPPPPPPHSTTGWNDWTTAPAPPPPPPPSATTPWPESESQSYGGGISYGQTWSDWNPSAPAITARANLAERQVDLSAPSVCYGPCDNAGLVAENAQLKASILCPTDGAWSAKYTNCGNCILTNKKSQVNHPVEVLFTDLAKFVDFCKSNSIAAPESSTASSAPAAPPTTTATRPPTTTPTTPTPSTTPQAPTTPPTTTPAAPASSSTTSSAPAPPVSLSSTSSAPAPPVSPSSSSSALPSTFTGAAAPLGGSPVLNLAMAIPLLINLGLA